MAASTAINIWTIANAADQTSICRSCGMQSPLVAARTIAAGLAGLKGERGGVGHASPHQPSNRGTRESVMRQFTPAECLSKVNSRSSVHYKRRSLQAMMPPLVVGFRAGERIDPVILGMAAVALDPVPVDSMGSAGGDKLLPQLGVLDRLPVGGPPAV